MLTADSIDVTNGGNVRLSFASKFEQCNITKGTGQAKLLQECEIVVWGWMYNVAQTSIRGSGSNSSISTGQLDINGWSCCTPRKWFWLNTARHSKQRMPNELKTCLKTSYIWKYMHKLGFIIKLGTHLQGDVSVGHFLDNYSLLTMEEYHLTRPVNSSSFRTTFAI